MIFAYLISIFIGILAGTITGLLPGIHINLVSILIVSSFFILENIPTNEIILFITSMSITHSFLDFIPSIYLGAPDPDTALGTTPGHEFLTRGLGHHALTLTLVGSTIAILLLFLIAPLFILLIPKIYPFIQRMLGFFLILISIFLIQNKKEKKLNTIIIFFLAGFLGISTLNSQIGQPLLPLFTGLFGSSTLIYSIKSNTQIPKQIISKPIIQKRDLIIPTIATFFISPLCSFFPGLGSSQAAIISSSIFKKIKKDQFLILLGSINTLVISISFLTYYLIQKSRTGSVLAISSISNIGFQELKLIAIAIIITTLLVIPITYKISKLFAKNIEKINYQKLSIFILLFLSAIIFLISGFLGFLIFITSTLLGLLCIFLEVRRGILMGCLLIPTIIYYLPI